MATPATRKAHTTRTLAAMPTNELTAALADIISELSRDTLKPSVKKALTNQMARIKAELAGRQAPTDADIAQKSVDVHVEPEMQAAPAVEDAPAAPAEPDHPGLTHGHSYGLGSAPGC